MKKEIIYYLLLIFVIAGLMVFETNMPGSKSINISKVIDVEHFDKLDIDLVCNIYVSLGEEQKVVLEGPEHSLNHIEARLENGILKLYEKNAGMLSSLFNVNQKSTGEVNLYLQLTATDQLLSPKKGNLITNEALNFKEANNQQLFSFSQPFQGILKLLGAQACFIPQLPL
jgi:hypothetical protein